MAKGITIIGLGSGDPKQLTLEAWQVLEEAEEIYLRTSRHPAASHLPKHLALHSFNRLCEGKNPDEAYNEIAHRIVELGGRPQGVVYAVPGHPLVDASTQRIMAMAEEKGLKVRIIRGMSFLESALTHLGLDPLDGLQVVDATKLAAQHYPHLDPNLPVLVARLRSRPLASSVKLTLMNLYPDEHLVTLVREAGTNEERVWTTPLCELGSQEGLDHSTSLYLPPLTTPGSLTSLQDVVARLRAPGGCPWDREQTHRSLRPELLEETYEVLEALDAGDVDKLCEELGDLLLEVVFHIQLAAEAGEFKLPQVIEGIVTKLKHRHPHVFGEVKVTGASEVLRHWEEIKREERGGKGSALDGVPRTLPALARAQDLQRRAARVGFDWPYVEGVLAKVAEEVQELKEAAGKEKQEEELGDLLFSLVNLARWL
ncbi:MAG: nucleoside triphosphate pyrophosphohydrolase, partial [Chloroflexota bacterium]|nr:nucleoside triphosphate pyrophosphohydrolase [Chloroflexota bacterium]